MKVKLLSQGARVPARVDEGSAGYDLYVPKDSTVTPGRCVIPLDISLELKAGTEGQIRPRSGFSLKGMEGYAESSSETPSRFDADVLIGTIDESYRGNVGVIIRSNETKPFIVKQGTRIAQLVIESYHSELFEVAEGLSETERGEQGFGHSGSA